MEYAEDGKPHIRVSLGSDVITISGNVNVGTEVSINNTPENPVPVTIVDSEIEIKNDINNPIPISANTSVNAANNPIYVAANVTGGNINAAVSGTVTVSSITNTANVNILNSPSVTVTSGNINANVSGSVTVTSVTNTVNVNILSIPEVEIKNDLNNPIPISANLAVNAANNPIYVAANVTGGNINANVSGTVVVSSITNTANVNILNSPSVTVTSGNINANVSGTITSITNTVNVNILSIPEVEIKNDVNNPIPISANLSVNSNVNPIYVSANISGGNVNVLPDLSVGDFYGEPYAIGIEPVVQMDGRYGIDSREQQTYTSGGGSVTAQYSCFKLSCTSTVGSYGVHRSRRFNTYKAGQSHLARGYVKFGDPVASTSQRWGVQNQENAFYIGYNGTNFGVLRIYNGRVPLYRLTLTSFTGSQNVTVTLNGVGYTTSILNTDSIQTACQKIALDGGYGGGLWLTTQRGNTVEFLYTGAVGPLGGTFSVTSSGTISAAITTIQAGVAATNEWTYPGGTDANGNYFPPLPSWLDPTTFQQWQIKYSWAGANFFVLDPTTGRYYRIFGHYHVGDTITQPQVANPAFKVAGLCYNLGGAAGVDMYVGEMSTFLEGQTNRNKYNRAAAVTHTSLAQNDLHHLLSIQNALTHAGTINTLEILLQDFTVSMQCNDPTEVYMFIDAPLSSGTHDFEVVGDFLAGVSKVTALLDLAAHEPIVSFIVGITGSTTQFDLSTYRTVIPPGATLTIACRSTAAIQKAAAGLVWYVD